VYTCNMYGRYHFDGTQELFCSAIVQRSEEYMKPSVAETNAKLYSKENKNLHKKDRK